MEWTRLEQKWKDSISHICLRLYNVRLQVVRNIFFTLRKGLQLSEENEEVKTYKKCDDKTSVHMKERLQKCKKFT